MTTVTIKGVTIKFPFPPYDIQKNYMEKVVECLEGGKNGVLESPTGTGKTLSLLCASLGWLEAKKKQYADQMKLQHDHFFKPEGEESPPVIYAPKIIYASRTHTQLHQAMQEMKKTAYSYMRACILGSREQMCIHEEVVNERNASAKVTMCRTKVKRNQCSYYSRVEVQRDNPELCDLSIIDMEDIMELGRCHDFCPYYMARELKTDADIIFIPYNYLLDPKTIKMMEGEICNNVIILDEAHNIEKVCEDSVSVQIKETDIKTAVEDISAIVDLMASEKRLDVEEVPFTSKELLILNKMLMTFQNKLLEINLVKLALEGTVLDGDYIFQILDESEISYNNFSGVMDLLSNIQEFFSATKLIQKNGYGLDFFSHLLHIIFYDTSPEYKQKIKECFKVQIEEKTDRCNNSFVSQSQHSQSQEEDCRVLNFWCFSPGFAMKMLINRCIHCVILTSGTLAPLQPLISELELNVGVQIENPHIVKDHQICVKVLSKGPDMELLKSNFQNRTNPKYLRSLGQAVCNLIRIIPNGVLIFFPSYLIMEKTIEHWHSNGIWESIDRIKSIYVEPKDKISFDNAMVDYYSKIQDPNYKGAIFMGVCRGKVSEGLDFADINGRAVIITGLPYPPFKDPKIILKKRYLDNRHKKNREYLNGDDWYDSEAIRAINQAVGRVIRHKNDYGAIILLDTRFAQPKVKNTMSLWLRRHITDTKNFGEAIKNVKSFFQNMEEKISQANTQQVDFEAPVGVEDNLIKVNTRRAELLESPSKRRK
jgi:regulator of telomere elongation helicase 1